MTTHTITLTLLVKDVGPCRCKIKTNDEADRDVTVVSSVTAINPKGRKEFTSNELLRLGVDIPTQIARMFDREPIHPNVEGFVDNTEILNYTRKFWENYSDALDIQRTITNNRERHYMFNDRTRPA